MGLGDFWLQFNNGKKGRLSDIKGDIRRETVDKKYQKIFDFFDTNKNGAIEGKEADMFLEVLSKFAGDDKVLTKKEEISVFAELGIKDTDGVDFVDFARELSEANKKIKTSEESVLPDGSRKVVTNYTNGARLTAVYYPDGELKYTIKEIQAKGTAASASSSAVNHSAEVGAVISDSSVNPTLRSVRKVEFSPRAKSELRESFGKHYEETAKNILLMIEQLLGDMTVWDRAGIDMRQAFVNGDLTDMFTAEGVKKLEELLAQAKDDKELGQKLVEMAQNQIGTFEFHLEKDFGIKDFDFERMENFHQTSTKYMSAKSLMQRVELLNKGMKEVKQLYQNALTKRKGVPNSDKLNSDYDKKFMEVLTEYFNGDEGVAAAFFNTMKEGLETGTKQENEENDVLITILERVQQATNQTLSESLQGEKFENLESRYKAEFKEIYGREDNTTEVQNIIQTGQEIGGTIKIGALTTIQILMSALTMGTGNAALIAAMSNPLVSYLTTVGTDYALSVAGALSSVNGLTAEKHEQILEGTLETAKFIGVGSLSAPLCRFVGNTMAKYTGKIFENGVKTATGNITTTVVSGESYLQNFCLKSANFTGSFGTELGVFTGYEVVTQDEDFEAAAGSQTTMLSQLKVINRFLQTALGKFVQTQSAKGQQKLAEQQYQKLLKDTGLDKAKITRYETPTGTRYTGEVNGVKFTATSEAEIQAKLLYIAAQKLEGINEGVKEKDTKEVKTVVKANQETPQSETLIDGKYNRELTDYDEIGNRIFEVKPKDAVENPEKIAELKAEIENLRKTEPQKAEELQIVLEMFTNPTNVNDVTDAQIDAVVNYLNQHYDIVEDYLTEQAGKIGISGENIGKFGHRIKGEWSTRDKVANYISDAIEKGKNKTLLDAYQDVRDKYACRTVFKNGDYTKHPEIVKILEEGNYSDAAYRKAQLRAAEIQSQPAVDMLKEAMRKAVKEGKDLSMIRISNYTSEGGIPIFSEAQLAELKEFGKDLDIDVTFIRLASEEDPNTNRMIVDGATTKAQPSGYTALQVNFVTKAGEIIEWQYRGELVNKFAEAEHLPYDIRTGKQPWRQYPELETLYKPIANLLAEKNMPKYAYDQLNRYFTDYYNHLRKLELGFESKEPKLEDYEHWKAKDENGVEREYTFRFDKRLSAKNLEALHFYGEGIKDGAIFPERALEEYNKAVGHEEVKQDANNPIQPVKNVSQQHLINELKEMGLTDNDISRINFNQPMLASGIELFRAMSEYNPEKFGEFPPNLLVNLCNHLDEVFNEDSPFMHYVTRDNVKALLEVAEFEESPLQDMNFWQDTDVSQLYRMAKYYFDITGEKLPVDYISRSNKTLKTQFPTNEQIEVAVRMEKAGLWDKSSMFSHSMDVQSPQKVSDKFIETIKEIKAEAKKHGAKLCIEFDLDDEGIELVNRIKEYNDKSPIDFHRIVELLHNDYLHPRTVVFYLEVQEKGINVPKDMLASLMREIDSMFSASIHADGRRDMAMFYIEHQDIYNEAQGDCIYSVRNADNYNIELTKKLIQDKDFPKELVHQIQQSISVRGNLPNYKSTDEEAVRFIQNKAKFAERLCTDKTINCPQEAISKLVENYFEGCEELVVNGIKTGLIANHPKLKDYPADCWNNILKRGLLSREVENIGRSLGYNAVVNYARAKDDNIVAKHQQLRQDALANKDLLKSGMEDISDWDIRNRTSVVEAIHTIDLIGLSNTEAAFPLMLEEFGEFLRETSTLSQSQLSEGNKELLLSKVNPAQTQKAKQLNAEITALKKQLNEAVGEENLAKIKEIQTKKSEVDSSISDLKTQLDNLRMSIPEYKEIAEKMRNLNQKSSEYKEYEKQLAEIENKTPAIQNLKNSIKELQKQSKALNGQAQSIYYSCENAAEVKELMKKLGPKQKELKEYLAENSGIEPQEVVTKIRVLSALAEISTEEEMAMFINMIKPSSPENNAVWNEAVNKKIYQKLGVEYDEVLSQKLDLIHCKYISKMFISNNEFFVNMKELVNVIKDNPELSVEETIDNMPQNIETRRIFEELGFDYEKYTKVDKDSFTMVKVKLSAEEAKQASIHNLEEDLNDALFQLLPKEATTPIFKQLKEELGVTFEKSQKDNWEGDGFSAGTTEYYRLYKDGKLIAFEDMDKIITLIKREINKNNFWTTTQGDEQLDNARKTMYTHIIKMRTQEVDNALTIRDGDIAEIEVRKTDMYDIKKALGLGNDAQCCTALGRNMNEWSAPTYIMNKCIGAIELNDKGSFVGNTMIYLAYVDGEPALVLDNIELKTKYQNNNKIRDTFIDYAKKLCEEIGQPDLPIYAGPNRHKLNMDIYPKAKHTMEIIGDSGGQEVYVDYDACPHFVGQGEKSEIEMYRIR